jgi:hypothetical protein
MVNRTCNRFGPPSNLALQGPKQEEGTCVIETAIAALSSMQLTCDAEPAPAEPNLEVLRLL